MRRKVLTCDVCNKEIDDIIVKGTATEYYLGYTFVDGSGPFPVKSKHKRRICVCENCLALLQMAATDDQFVSKQQYDEMEKKFKAMTEERNHLHRCYDDEISRVFNTIGYANYKLETCEIERDTIKKVLEEKTKEYVTDQINLRSSLDILQGRFENSAAEVNHLKMTSGMYILSKWTPTKDDIEKSGNRFLVTVKGMVEKYYIAKTETLESSESTGELCFIQAGVDSVRVLDVIAWCPLIKEEK